ncbi:MAG: hypothetical protein M5U27_14870 [Gaiella sp.]|nr:hypothetical protein [Gaiella sp.]
MSETAQGDDRHAWQSEYEALLDHPEAETGADLHVLEADPVERGT